jgi:EAL domain-containing protein (putative c-di-GMP-specific phosphodiesterase class I)
VARVNADGFGIVVRGALDAAGVAHIVENEILACFRESYAANGTELRLAARAGIALFPTDGDDADTLFRNAEAALKKAKGSSERYLFYAAEMNARAAQALSLETRLRTAIESRQFVLHYQPKIALASSRICGVEALIRWQDPAESGLVPPARFIPILEETGMILDVGAWAIQKALADYDEWHARGLQPPRVAVNVSQIQLRQKDFVDMVSSAVKQSIAMPHGLDLEITESLIMKDVEENIRKLKAVRDLGVNIVIDDFGTGYSSLGYLARLPVNALKIDRSFIIKMTSDPDNMTIVSTIIALAHSLNLKVVAEGVETEEQSRFLKLLKCDEMQGYLFSKPLPVEQLAQMLAERKDG